MLVAKTNPKGTYGQTSEIIQFLKDGERAIRISPQKDVVLVLGVTGSGKSTLSQFLTGNDEHLVAVEQGEDTGEFIIQDKGNKVCSATTESCTTVPDLFVDRRTQTPFYDCPGFIDTRHVKHDLSVTYFIKKVIDSADSVKLIFAVSYPSLRRGVDRQNFMLLVKTAGRMIKDIDKFKDSIAMIVTKVDNQYIVKKGKAIMVSDKNIINNIASFLEEVKNNLIAKISEKSLPDSGSMVSAVKFIDILLTKNGEEYPKIGIFRRPDDAGKLDTTMMLENKKNLGKIVHQNLNFTQCDTDDFGYSVSAESINRMHDMVEEVNEKIGLDVEAIAREIKEGFLLHERDANDVEILYKKFHLGFEAMRNITNLGKSAEPSEFLMKIRETAGVLNIDVSRKSVDSILHYDRFLKFIRTLSGIPTAKPLEWAEGLTDVVQSFDDSQKWYYFLINLHRTLLKHDVQKNLSRNSSVLDDLRDTIGLFGDDASPVKNNLKLFLAQVYKDDSEKEYNSIKNAKLNSWKLKFLKDMLDFQVLTLCQDNKLVVVGNYVHLSDVARKKCDDVKFLEIFALRKLFIDADFDRTGWKIQVSMLAPTWEVIGSPKIVVDGEPGRDHTFKASNGAWSGADGYDGSPGLPGGAAGNFLGFGWNCINCQFLTVSANGGSGGKGQDGGDGADGKEGEKPPRPNHSKNIFNIGLLRVSHEDRGSQGGGGGNGGKGGAGGKGGNKGKVSIVMFDTPRPNLPKVSDVDGRSGISGNGGKGGAGGQSEHVIESSTYIFGLHAWSNGLVSHFLYRSANGISSQGENYDGMEYPEPPVDLVNPSHAVNHYKAYIRESLDSSLSRMSLEEFLEQLETSEEVRDLYDTLGLVHDLQCLENQYSKLHRRVPLLPFYKSLLDKVEAYARDPPYSEMGGQHRKVRAFLYMSTLSKICSIDNNLNNDLVINVKDFLGTVVKDVDQLLKDFMVAKQSSDRRAAFQKRITSKINEANNLIKEDVSQESQRIFAELDAQIRGLVSETQQLQNITRKELKKLNERMLSRGISAVLRIASRALDFFGVVGLATEGVIEGTNLISKTLTLDDADSPLSEGLGILPKTVDYFLSSIVDNFKEKINLFVAQLFDVDKIFRDFKGEEIPALNETRSVLSEAREEFSQPFELSDYPEEDVEKLSSRRSELLEFLQEQKKTMEKALKGDPNLEKALDVLEHSEQILMLPEGVYNVLKESKIEDYRSGELDVNDKLKQLEAYEAKIYSVIIPVLKKLKTQFNDLDAFDGVSGAALDVGKWKVQNALSDVNTQISSMTEGFQVQGAMATTMEKLKFGISTMIQVYDRIQDYRDQAALADYMAEIASKAKQIQVTDRKLSDAIDDLQMILKTNLILADYEMAMNAFGQHVFPFAKAYMEEYDLPTSLKGENSTDDLLSEAIYRINSVERKLVKNDMTINKRLDDHFFPDVLFASRSQYGPFYVWKYETSSNEISRLLKGEEVLLHADITKGLSYNAVKFNGIGIRFKLANEASQIDFDEKMEKFSIQMNHFGMSYYRCGNKFYVMTHDTQKIDHSVNEDDVGSFVRPNNVCEKISKNVPLLSPYTMWRVKLHSVSGSFQDLANFTNEIFDLALEGHGTFVSRDVDRDVCSDHLDQYYKLEGNINELPAIEYKVNQNRTGEDPEVIVTRRRRSVDSEVNLTSGDVEESKSGLGVFTPLKKFVKWFSGGFGKVLNTSDPPEDNTYQIDESLHPDGDSGLEHVYDAPAPSLEFVQQPQSPGKIGGDGSQSPSSQVNYDLVATQSNLLLLDLLMRLRTGAKRSSMTKNVDAKDDDYAHTMAYRAYVPHNEGEVIIVQ